MGMAGDWDWKNAPHRVQFHVSERWVASNRGADSRMHVSGQGTVVPAREQSEPRNWACSYSISGLRGVAATGEGQSKPWNPENEHVLLVFGVGDGGLINYV